MQNADKANLMGMGTDIVNMEMVADNAGPIPAQNHDFTISRLSYPHEIQGLCGRRQQDTATLAPHLSWYPNGIREEQRFGLEECRKSVRGN
jgi:hypothetical protein